MTSIAELEHRLQLAQEAEEAASMNLRFQQQRVRMVLEELTKVRIEQGES